MPNPRPALPAFLLAAGLLWAGCGGSDSAAPKQDGGTATKEEKKEEKPPLKEMPKDYPKSGIKEDYAKLKEAESAAKYAKKDAKEAAEAALEALVKELVDKYSTKEVHGAECHYLALLMDKANRPGEAMAAAKRYVEVARGTDSKNFEGMVYLVLKSQAAMGDLDGAEIELSKAQTGDLASKSDLVGATAVFIAKAAEAKGDFAQAARMWEVAMVQGAGDPEAAIFGTDCLQRAGNMESAVRLAKKAVEGFASNPKNQDRMKDLLAAVELVGQDAPGFPGAKHWKGTGGPIDTAALKGTVTVIFSWNLQMRTAKQFFHNLNKVQGDYSDRGLQVVGISRIEKYDPIQDGTIADMTEETELAFYDTWEQQFGTRCAFAIAGHEDFTLVNAWAASRVPGLIVVGKNGKVAYTRTGYLEEHFDALRQMIDREYAK